MTDQTIPLGHSTLPVVCSRKALMPFCRKRRRDSWGQTRVESGQVLTEVLSTHQGAGSNGLKALSPRSWAAGETAFQPAVPLPLPAVRLAELGILQQNLDPPPPV